jgi:hypothetical protein
MLGVKHWFKQGQLPGMVQKVRNFIALHLALQTNLLQTNSAEWIYWNRICQLPNLSPCFK